MKELQEQKIDLLENCLTDVVKEVKDLSAKINSHRGSISRYGAHGGVGSGRRRKVEESTVDIKTETEKSYMDTMKSQFHSLEEKVKALSEKFDSFKSHKEDEKKEDGKETVEDKVEDVVDDAVDDEVAKLNKVIEKVSKELDDLKKQVKNLSHTKKTVKSEEPETVTEESIDNTEIDAVVKEVEAELAKLKDRIKAMSTHNLIRNHMGGSLDINEFKNLIVSNIKKFDTTEFNFSSNTNSGYEMYYFGSNIHDGAFEIVVYRNEMKAELVEFSPGADEGNVTATYDLNSYYLYDEYIRGYVEATGYYRGFLEAIREVTGKTINQIENQLAGY